VSWSDSESGTPADERTGERLRRLDEFAADLNARGYADVLVLRRENGREVPTERRSTLIQYLSDAGDDVQSASDLARRLDRDKGAVSKDLHRLAELDVIAYEGEGVGEAKRPVLKHDHVVIEPVLY
jgi:broad specificity phosphatase PhoE